ncbi:hypothetical protein STAS_10716 [Striga asiatica]|uniref:Glycine-rich protein n=1 Tax=Striga asiatica TaxID=4170 RepID=A0A5A7PPG4_STRAF|nr:hypothetical protein STAS_10716 [Striga asiatica]
MESKAFIFIALVLFRSVLADEVAQNENIGDEPMKHPTTFGGYPAIPIPYTGGAGAGAWASGGGGGGAAGGGGGPGGGGPGGGGPVGGGPGGGGPGGGGPVGGGPGGAEGGGAEGGAEGGGGAGGYSGGFSHGGVYGGGQICKFGCCSESHGYSHKGGGYFGCTCCGTIAEAKAYNNKQNEASRLTQAKN